MRGFLNLGFSYSIGPDGQMHNGGGYFIFNTSCRAMPGGVALNSCGGYSGLQSGWKAQVHKDIAAIGPALKNGSIIGVYLGDEIVETARIPWEDYAALATELKATMALYGGGLVYGNEGAWYNLGQYNQDGPCPPLFAQGCNASQCYEEPCTGFTWYDPPEFPDALDLFSFDNYVPISCNQSETCSGVKPAQCATLRSAGMNHWNLTFSGPCSEDPAQESRRTREIYEKLLYPKMKPHQRLLLVPGLFADAELAANRSGSLAEQDAFMVAKLHHYRQWMREDEKIAGMWGWHWGAEPIKTTLHAGYTIGTYRLPKTIAMLQDMAKETKQKWHSVKTDDGPSDTSTVICTNETDCTADLQAALFDVAVGHVIVPQSRGQKPWHTHPLLINRSNLVLTLEPGVVIQAVRGAFHSGVLLKASGAHNLTIRGEGASLRMWRSDYANASVYKHSEFRAGLSFYYCHNVSVSGLEIAETGASPTIPRTTVAQFISNLHLIYHDLTCLTGGDGVYIEGIIGGVFRNITTDGAYRNGMSVIYAENLLVENCSFRNTGNRGTYNGGDRLTPANGGTAPRAGVDFEPDAASEVLFNVTFRDVVADGNVDDAFDFSADTNHSILMERCHALNCAGEWGSAFAFNSFSGPGLVTLRDCSAENMPGAAIKVPTNGMETVLTGSGLSLLVQNFSAANVATDHVVYNGHAQGFFPITIQSSHHKKPVYATKRTIKFDGVQLWNISRGDRPFIGCQNVSSSNGFEPAKCAPASIWPLRGNVAAWVANKSGCSLAGIGEAGTKLSVTCHKSSWNSDEAPHPGRNLVEPQDDGRIAPRG
jgi:hypothetical protein